MMRVNSLLDIIPKLTQPIILRVRLRAAPHIRTLVERHCVSDRALKNALE
jgi:hypothetical protein